MKHTLFALIVATIASLMVAASAPAAASLTAIPNEAAPVQDMWGCAAGAGCGGVGLEGEEWLAWAADLGGDTELYYSRRLGSRWSAPQRVVAAPGTWQSNPSLAFAPVPDDTLWLVWASASLETSQLYLSRWDGLAWTEPEQVPTDPALAADEPTMAATPDGSLWLAWVGFDGVDDEVYASRLKDGRWSPAQQISNDEGDESLYDRQPRLAVGEDGRPWLVWTGHEEGVDDEIYASHWTGTGWSAPQMVSEDDDALDVDPSLAIDVEGRPWVAWKARVGEEGESRLRVMVSRWESGWSPEAIASSDLATAVDEMLPALTVDCGGTLHLAWLATAADGNSAIAFRRQSGIGFQPARLVQAGVDTHALALLPSSGEAIQVAWPELPVRGDVPLQLATAAEDGPTLDEWVAAATPEAGVDVDPISNRFLAFGDSITWGQYPVDDPVQPPFYPYPSTLEYTLETRVMDSEVINSGVPGEGTGKGKNRVKTEVSTWEPQYVMIMEGTNNVSHDALPSDVLDDYLIMIDNARKHAGVDHVKVILATLIPRLDSRNNDTAEMNAEAVLPAANQKNIPVCDQWSAFYDYINQQGIPLSEIYWDEKHPNQEGLDLFAATWYDCLLANYSWLEEETTPPTTWIESVPATVECDEDVPVTWTGTDNLSWVVDYDVQANLNGGTWSDWLVGTTDTSGVYAANYRGGDVVGFHVRGRDVVGNQSNWSEPAYVNVVATTPPSASLAPLPQVATMPFWVSWQGTDNCSEVVAYDVEYRLGSSATWTRWLSAVPNLGMLFDEPIAAYGPIHFHVRAKNAYDIWGPWSAEVSTIVAQYTLAGTVHNVRHEPVIGAQVSLSPAALATYPAAGGGFRAHLASGGSYDVAVSRDALYGSLPPMQAVTVTGDVEGLTFVLPPQDDAVENGGFEAGSLAGWQAGGSVALALDAQAHTGDAAVLMGGTGASSTLSQVPSPAAGMSEPTLSLMVRLEQPGPASEIEIRLSNTTTLSPAVVYTLPVASKAWSHAWYDLTGLIGEPFTLTFIVSDTAAILLDEISLGSAVPGGHQMYLPVVDKNG